MANLVQLLKISWTFPVSPRADARIETGFNKKATLLVAAVPQKPALTQKVPFDSSGELALASPQRIPTNLR